MGILKGFDRIKKLSFERIIFNQGVINEIVALPKLKEIEFDFCYLENGNIDALKNLPNLTIKNVDELIIEEKISTDGKCGEEYGKCPSGQCCSKYGYCGKSKDYCESGCQSDFGKCN